MTEFDESVCDCGTDLIIIKGGEDRHNLILCPNCCDYLDLFTGVGDGMEKYDPDKHLDVQQEKDDSDSSENLKLEDGDKVKISGEVEAEEGGELEAEKIEEEETEDSETEEQQKEQEDSDEDDSEDGLLYGG